jgi:hypothetical protein
LDFTLKVKTYDELFDHYCLNDNEPGFHGDLYLIDICDSLLKKSDCFIETGTNLGNTLFFVSRNYELPCYTCEVHDKTPKDILDHSLVKFYNIESPKALSCMVSDNVNILSDKVFFWLDAHHGSEEIWKTELDYILDKFKKYYIIIDDCDIHNSNFTHNGYDCNTISDYAKNMSSDILVYKPSYNEQTSKFHALTGWVLLTNDKTFNSDILEII